MSKRTSVLALLVCSIASPVLAAEKGQIGLALSTGSVSTVGAFWHVSNRVALEPAVGFSVQSTDQFCVLEDAYCEPSSGTHYSLYGGLGLRYYFAPGRTVSPYLRTRLSYSATLHYAPNDSNTISWTVSAAGLQYSPSKHFSVFGDLGVSVTRQSQDELGGNYRTWTVGTFTSSIGVVLYLN